MTRKLIFTLTFMAVVLMGCSGGSSGDRINATTLPPLRFEPIEALTIAGVCEDSRALEQWLQVIDTHLLIYVDVINEAEDKSLFDLREDIVYLSDLRDFAVAQAAPDCAAETQRAVVDAMTITLRAFEDYVNGEDVDVTIAVQTSRDAFADVRLKVDALIEQLEVQIQSQ
jgi:hypothetical protein